MRKAAALIAGALLLAAPGAALAQRAPAELAPVPSRLTSPVLETFASEAEFHRYLRDVRREARKRRIGWGHRGQPVRVASLQDADAAQDAPCATPEECPAEDSVVVSGSRASKPKSITNNQEAGVDEGDIVKQIGRFLLVLQDGRIFSVDTGKGDTLRLVDRINIYRESASGVWYDEMLVQDRYVIVTAYSYEDDATEVSVFHLDDAGRLSSRGVFLISSDDYYDTENYATRIAGDQLVIYSPLDISDIQPDQPVRWPLVRRWLPEDQRPDDYDRRGVPMFDARTIHKPIQPTLAPTVHTISACPIGPVARGRDMRCRTTAFVGPGLREFYVTPTDVFLWVMADWDEYYPQTWSGSGNKCDSWQRRGPAEARPAALFRVPLGSDEPTAMLTQGVPPDQFSFDARDGRLRALLHFEPLRCGADADPEDEDEEKQPTNFQLFDTPLSRLDVRPRTASRSAYTAMPDPGTQHVENRFTDKHLVYGGRRGWGSWPPDKDEKDIDSRAIAVPLKAPAQAAVVAVPHSIIRLENIGASAVMTGYRNDKGLSISLLDLGATPRIASTEVLARRFESEGRSHAFNSAIEADGRGIMGLPTVLRPEDADRWWWRSESSDVSFLTLGAGGKLAAAGELKTREDAVDPGYECEVSCIDWYGNTRPIFTDGRIFALSGTELIEGRLEGGRIAEIRRLNLSAPPPPRP